MEDMLMPDEIKAEPRPENTSSEDARLPESNKSSDEPTPARTLEGYRLDILDAVHSGQSSKAVNDSGLFRVDF